MSTFDMLTVARRKFVADTPAARPLSFERLNEGRLPTSNFGPFRLPLELLPYITKYLDSPALATLALVDRDCNLLARSCQFASVVFDWSPASDALLDALRHEGMMRRDNPTLKGFRSIGACIRHVTVDIKVEYVLDKSANGTNRSRHVPESHTGSDQQRRNARRPATLWEEKTHIPPLCFPFEHALINMEALAWENESEIPLALMQSLANTRLLHLRFRHISVLEGGYKIPQPSPLASHRWALKTLELKVLRDWGGSENTFLTSLLISTSSTLESLLWSGDVDRMVPHPPPHTFGSDIPTFPRLRKLVMFGSIYDNTFLDALLSGNTVRSLLIDPSPPKRVEWLNDRGDIPSLEELIWESREFKEAEKGLPFVADNPWLTAFAAVRPLPSAFVEHKLLPLFAARFFALSSLYLAWDSDQISPSALESIGQLTSLKKLFITAGDQDGWRHTWLIRHDVMRQALRGCRLLEKVAFSRDTYEGDDVTHTNGEVYYVNRVLPPGREIDSFLSPEEIEEFNRRQDTEARVERVQRQRSDAAWERWHEECMIAEADLYARQFPHLDFVHLGMCAFSVEEQRNPADGKTIRKAVPLTNGRETTLFRYLREMWGIYSG